MYSPLPVYSLPKKSNKRWIPTKSSASLKPAADVSPPPTASSTHAAPTRLFQGFSDMLDPAVDGPPSPERLRAIANQMRQASISEKHQSQQTVSSGSSSLVSTGSDRPSWEHGVESLTLSRKSSQRSTTSSMPSRERPESVQFFGKSLFNRRGKGRRASGDLGSSSNGSLHSAESSGDATNATSKERDFFMSLRPRRNTAKDDELPQSRIQISGPYNFQHVAHTEKDQAPKLDRSSRMELAHDFSEMRHGRRPRNSSLRGVPQYSHQPTGSYSAQQDPSAGFNVSQDVPPELRDVSPPQVPMRSVKRTQSQDRVAPLRPPRSPTEHDFTCPIPPPPRISSRTSVRPEVVDGFVVMNLERPLTNSGFRVPKPIVFPKQWESPAHGHATTGEGTSAPDHRFSHAITTPDNAAWPLPADTLTKALPDVPEEEESHGFSRSRMSIASNSSSLRGSISVPLLRQMSQSQAASIVRPPSGASETLGRFDLLAAQRALRANADDESIYEDFAQDNWEDDIDYCYEHEAEADCDYAWERPSLDLIREDEHISDSIRARYPSHGSGSSGLLSPPGCDDVPALSPVSQVSNATHNEAKTPTVSVLPVTSNFSLPRRDSSALLLRSHNHTSSQSSSYKETTNYDLSPSLLIPSDYHHQMLMHERAELREEDEDVFVAPLSPSGTHFAHSTLHARSSASTTDSIFSRRHQSNTSTSTVLTRWTSNSTSTANVEGWQLGLEDKDHLTVASFEKIAISPLPELEEARLRRDPSAERHGRAQSHANVLVKSSSETTMADHLKPGKDTVKTRRRAKTTSRSHNQAPVSLGLFPSTTFSRP